MVSLYGLPGGLSTVFEKFLKVFRYSEVPRGTLGDFRPKRPGIRAGDCAQIGHNLWGEQRFNNCGLQCGLFGGGKIIGGSYEDGSDNGMRSGSQ